jgi:acetyl-CoA carboxylase carboxyltransferase component
MAFNWTEQIEELDRRRAFSKTGGGAERIARKHAKGELTIRERIELLGTRFREVGGLARMPEYDHDGHVIDTLPSSYVCGLAEIDGRDVAVGGEDFTVGAGAPQMYLDRMKGGLGGFVEDLAHEYRIPLMLFCEGIGGDVGGIDIHGHSYLVSSFSWGRSIELLSEVPVIVGVLGAAAGGTAGRAVLSHFTVATKGSVMFAGGPPLVRRALGKEIHKSDLGGAEMHTTVSGGIDNLAEDEEDAIRQMRRVLSYLPQNVWEMAPEGPREDPIERREEDLLTIIPENRRRPYKMRRIIDMVADQGSVFEMGPKWGRALVTCFARIDGIPVGVLGNNPMHIAGAIDGPAAEKQMRFLGICRTFHLPVVYFVDVPGFMVGPDAERGNVVRKGMGAIQALHECGVPVISVHVRKAFGMAAQAVASIDRLGMRLAWPSAEWGDMPIEGGVEAAFRRAIDAAEDPVAFREMAERRLLDASNPWLTAEAFGIEDMIDPRETREVVARFLRPAYASLKSRLGEPTPWRIRP